MNDHVALSCRCETVTATVERADSFNLVCYCKDCRAFARLKGETDSLVQGGGVVLLQSAIDRLEILSGHDRVACMQFKSGAPLRWFATCCDAPLWLSLPRPGVPHLSVPSSLAKDSAAFGPVRGRVHQGSALGPVEQGGMGLRGVAARMIWRILRAKFCGAAKASPLYDPKTGLAISKPRHASQEELSRAYDE